MGSAEIGTGLSHPSVFCKKSLKAIENKGWAIWCKESKEAASK
jgi:hypothetical protein